MERDFLGKGWRFPLLPEGGGLGYVSDAENVEQSLRLLLLTGLGERVMRADFGCKAPQMVFAPGGAQQLRLLEQTVRDAVRDWEPRIELQDVRAEADEQDESRVTVQIGYLIRQTNIRGNLVFPFYLGSEGAP